MKIMPKPRQIGEHIWAQPIQDKRTFAQKFAPPDPGS